MLFLRNRLEYTQSYIGPCMHAMGNLGEFKDEIEEFFEQTGLKVLDKKEVGLTELEHVILEAIQRLK